MVFVIGNESCDLDSAVSAISLAYFYTTANEIPKKAFLNRNQWFLPVMDIKRANDSEN